MRIKSILYTVLIWIVLVGVGFPAMPENPSYVSPSGSGSACTTGSPCALSYANTNAIADDVVILKTGNYTTQQIAPVNSGTGATDVITFQKDTGATCTFSRAGPSVDLNGDSYIVIDGMTFGASATVRHILLQNASNYNEIKNCTFTATESYADVELQSGSNHNYIHDNTFNPGGEASDDASETDTIQIEDSEYNRIIENTFNDGHGHFFIMFTHHADYNIFRGNAGNVSGTWTNQYAGIDFFFGGEHDSNYNLIEDNVFTIDLTGGEVAAKSQEWEWDACSYNIIRSNISKNARGGNAFFIQSNRNYHNEYNMIYNNTYYNINRYTHSTDGVFALDARTGYYTRYNQFVNNLIHTSPNHGTRLILTTYVADNQFRNNTYWNITDADVDQYGTDRTIDYMESVSGDPSNWSGNITTPEPTFTDAPNGDFTADDGDAPQVDTGAWLTTVNGGTTSTTFLVDDYPYMFYWGYDITGETGDVIKTEGGQTCVIESINHGAKQITCVDPITVVDGEGIALDYAGIKPDIGAEEYSAPAPGVGIENPTPSDEATGQSVDVDISWTNGGDVTKTDIYFDDTDCTTEVDADEDAETSYEPGTLANSDTFYWKIITEPDGVNLSFPATGCYTFTTVGTPPDLGGAIYNSGAGAAAYNSGGAPWKFVAP